MKLSDALRILPIFAILRGVKPEEAERICGAFIEAGFRSIEVPLNSPEPLRSIEIMAHAFSGAAAIGAGTVLTATQAKSIADAGGVFAVAPNTDKDVIAASLAAGLTPVPGFMSPSEAFVAIASGARHLKLFPADGLPPAQLKALKAVLPPGTSVYAVGGVSSNTMGDWIKAGAAGFGLGSSVYKPGDSPADVLKKARQAAETYKNNI